MKTPVAEGWDLFTSELSAPILCGPNDLSADIRQSGEVLIVGTGDVVGALVVPMRALHALINAHAEWEQSQKREAEKNESGGANVRKNPEP